MRITGRSIPLTQVYLAKRITALFEESPQTYGSPRIHAVLKTQEEKISPKRVARLMRKYQFVARKKQRFKLTMKVDKRLPIAENLLQRDLKAQRPNQKWVFDITYIWTYMGWLYVVAILDLFFRQVMRLSMSQRQTEDLVIRAFQQAIRQRGHPPALVHHSDRGSQYASCDFQNLLKTYGITPSMSGTGNCYDNAAMESFLQPSKENGYFLNTMKIGNRHKIVFLIIVLSSIIKKGIIRLWDTCLQKSLKQERSHWKNVSTKSGEVQLIERSHMRTLILR